MDWVKRHQELVLQKFRNEQVFMPPSMENELKAIRALLDTQEENQALTAENRELRELVREVINLIKQIPTDILRTQFKQDNTPYVCCIMCEAVGNFEQFDHMSDCIGMKATALLPRLEKAGKEAQSEYGLFYLGL